MSVIGALAYVCVTDFISGVKAKIQEAYDQFEYKYIRTTLLANADIYQSSPGGPMRSQPETRRFSRPQSTDRQ